MDTRSPAFVAVSGQLNSDGLYTVHTRTIHGRIRLRGVIRVEGGYAYFTPLDLSPSGIGPNTLRLIADALDALQDRLHDVPPGRTP